MAILWRDNILWWRKNKRWRFKLDDGWNFFLGNQQLFLSLIRLGLLLPSKLQIMGQKLNFGCHGWKQAQNNIFGALIHTIWLTSHNVCRGQLFTPKLKFWHDLVMSYA